MTEKIFDSEILAENQLEKISGGTTKEIKRDINSFKAKGVLPENTPSKDADALKKAFAKFGVDAVPKEGCYSHENIYSFNGKKKNQPPRRLANC